jgi:TonB family protein
VRNRLLLLVALVALVSCTVKLDRTPVLRYSPFLMWQYALTRCTPEYPTASSLRGASGLVVVSLTLSSEGRPSNSEVLQAPDAETGAAGRSCAQAWSMKADDGHKGLRRGKLFFYFLRSPTNEYRVYVANDRTQWEQLRQAIEESRK